MIAAPEEYNSNILLPIERQTSESEEFTFLIYKHKIFSGLFWGNILSVSSCCLPVFCFSHVFSGIAIMFFPGNFIGHYGYLP